MITKKVAVEIYFFLAFYFIYFSSGQVTDPTLEPWRSTNITSYSSSSCRQHLYSFQCLEAPECAWCCDAPFGSQCMEKDVVTNASAMCSADALLSVPGTTCRDLCHASGFECAQCEKKKWCYFCLSSSTCQAPEEHCNGNAIVQHCKSSDSDSDNTDDDEFYGLVIISVALGLIVMSIMGISGALIYRRVMQRRHDRIIAEQQQRYRMQQNTANMLMQEQWGGEPHPGEERERLLPESSESHLHRSLEGVDDNSSNPILSHTSSILGDDPMCYLCLSARPSVTFLPCYHTCCCEVCSNRLRPVSGTIVCPFCRVEIKSMVSLTNVLQWSVKEGSA